MSSKEPDPQEIYTKVAEGFGDVKWKAGPEERGATAHHPGLSAPYNSNPTASQKREVLLATEMVWGDVSLRFDALTAANAARCPLFKNAQGETQHSGADWSIDDWFVATIGELGETANVMKKIRRGDFKSLDYIRHKLAAEFADVMIYADMLIAETKVIGIFRQVDFGLFRKTNVEKEKWATPHLPAFRMGMTMKFLGRAWSAYNQDRKDLFASRMRQFLTWLDLTAHAYDIDLGRAVMGTFNAKSKQLRLPIFLMEDGFLTAPYEDAEPEVTSDGV